MTFGFSKALRRRYGFDMFDKNELNSYVGFLADNFVS